MNEEKWQSYIQTLQFGGMSSVTEYVRFFDEVAPENLTPESLWQVTDRLDEKIEDFLYKYTNLTEEELLETRYERFRKF